MPKELKFIDLNLISGSTEITRTAFGGYYDIVSGTYGEYLEPVEIMDTDVYQAYFDPAPTDGENGATGEISDSGIGSNLNFEETISDKVIIPNKRFPVRVYPNEDTIKDDLFWKTIWMGGTYGTSSYKPIWTDAVFDDHSFDYSLPYSQKESITIEGGSAFTDVAQITYDYNRYLRGYQSYIEGIDELLIPNMYLLKSYEDLMVDTESGEEAVIQLSSSIINFVTLENNVLTEFDGTYFDFPTNAFDSKEVALGWNSLLLEDDFASTYLTSSLLLYPLSASTTAEIKTILQNIMFDDAALDLASLSSYNTIGDELPDSSVVFGDDASATSTHSLTYKAKIPFYTTVTFDTNRSTNTASAESIIENDFSQKFLKTLKEVFLGEANGLTPGRTTFAVESSYFKASEDSGSIAYYDIRETENKSYRSIDYLKMLVYAHNNNISTTNNCYFIGGETFNRNSVFDKIGNYRHSNAEGSLGVINDMIEWLNNEDNFSVIDLWRLYNDVHGDNAVMASKYYETLAYRVEKIGGPPTGDSQTKNVLQNFWFFNPNDIEEINLCDSQVKYGSTYTYNVYAYVLTSGVKYNFSDLRLTNQIGTTTGTGGELTGSENYSCLQFYDAETGALAEQLFNSWENNYLSGSTAWASNAQVIAPVPYLADFYINYEPNLKLIEVPIFSKSLQVSDHPPNTFDINPYQVNDDSQTIGFNVNYETFYIVAEDIAGVTFPTSIYPADEIYKTSYLESRDILSSSYLDLESVSRQRFFEAYRLDEKPKSISDFRGNQINQIDLSIPFSNYTYSNTDFRDRIKTNQKYYYLFRFINEQGVTGQLSDIYEVELVDDGGYKYAVFNILFESDLGEEVFINPLKPFKKIFQLQPNISHVLLDASEADFNNFAADELGNISVGSADDPIWDQTFKLRMTSKKTGKKIDFNITYKVNDQSDAT